jgi:hypothetical protein
VSRVLLNLLFSEILPFMMYQLALILQVYIQCISAAPSSDYPNLTPRDDSAITTIIPSTVQGCIASNPDVAGVGVRISTYIQSLLTLFPTFIFLVDGYLDSRDREVLHKNYINLLVTACALLLSSLIQAGTFRLSVYHVLIVLNLSWMLNASALIICVLPAIDHLSEHEPRWRDWIRTFWPSQRGQISEFLLVSLHLCVMGSLGIWMWSNPIKFGNTSVQCADFTFTSIFTFPISASSSHLRMFSLVAYAIAATPVLNAAIVITLAVSSVNLINRLICRPFTFRRLYYLAMGLQLLGLVIFITDTELIIQRNRALVAPGESQWQLGQTLALVLVIAPLAEAVSVLKPKIPWGKLRDWIYLVEYWYWRWQRPSKEGWSNIYKDAEDLILQAIGFFPAPASGQTVAVPSARAVTRASLEVARAALSVANTILGCTPVAPPANQITSDNIEDTKRNVEYAREKVARARRLRFSEVDCVRKYSDFNSSLEAAYGALDAAIAALDTVR